jgi:hypothetical protein
VTTPTVTDVACGLLDGILSRLDTASRREFEAVVTLLDALEPLLLRREAALEEELAELRGERPPLTRVP